MPRVVSFHYTLRDPSGRVLDSSAGGQPVTYLEGAGMIIDGLDQRLRAVAAGAKERVQVPFAEAYGPQDPEQMQRVRRTDLPVEGELSIGDQFQTGPHRSDPVVTIAAIEGEEVLLDANHPLAGVDLLPARDGRVLVLEVNAVPGWRGLESVVGPEVAEAVADHVAQRGARFNLRAVVETNEAFNRIRCVLLFLTDLHSGSLLVAAK
jgi:FKBP-type peptidyl-prolyl cis-trans isomerase SlyD